MARTLPRLYIGGMTDRPDPRPLLGFNVMVQAEDAQGVCFLAYGCAARDADEAVKLVVGAASSEGFWDIEVDEVWRPDGAEDPLPGTVPEVFGRLEPTYVDEEEVGPDWDPDADDDEREAEEEPGKRED